MALGRDNLPPEYVHVEEHGVVEVVEDESEVEKEGEEVAAEWLSN